MYFKILQPYQFIQMEKILPSVHLMNSIPNFWNFAKSVFCCIDLLFLFEDDSLAVLLSWAFTLPTSVIDMIDRQQTSSNLQYNNYDDNGQGPQCFEKARYNRG